MQQTLIEQLLVEEQQHRAHEIVMKVRMTLVGLVLGGCLVALLHASWLTVAIIAVVLSALWLKLGPIVARVVVAIQVRRRGPWRDDLLPRVAAALAYRVLQNRTNALGSRHIDHAARCAAAVESDPRAAAVAWLQSTLDCDPSAAPEIAAFPPDIAAAVTALSSVAHDDVETRSAAVAAHPLALAVQEAGQRILDAQRERARRNRERAAQHEEDVGPKSEIEVLEDAA